MRADVGDGAQRAALLGVEPPVPVGRLQQPVLDVDAVDAVDRAEVAAADPRAGLPAERVEADVVVRAVDEPALLGEPEQLAGLRGGQRQRLLADDVLAGREHGLHLRVVEVVRRRQVDDADAVVVQHRLEALVRLRQAGFWRARGRRADDARHVDTEASERLDVDDADEPGPDDGRSDHAPTLTRLREDDAGGREGRSRHRIGRRDRRRGRGGVRRRRRRGRRARPGAGRPDAAGRGRGVLRRASTGSTSSSTAPASAGARSATGRWTSARSRRGTPCSRRT